MNRAAAESSAAVEGVLERSGVVVVGGPGGVGKTTMAAVLAARAAMNTRGRVLVLTVDPARRLADAMGVGVSAEPTRVDLGPQARGELWAAMLDSAATWDRLIGEEGSAPVARAVLESPLYGGITRRFGQSHEYAAVQELERLYSGGTFDLIVLDTPPSDRAIDVLDAPGRMIDFFGGRLLRWLTAPYRSRGARLAAVPFNRFAARVLGRGFVSDLGGFFALLATMGPGLVERARAVRSLLESPETAYVVVSTATHRSVVETGSFLDALEDRGLRPGMLVVNRVLPRWLAEPELEAALESIPVRSGELVAAMAALMEGYPASRAGNEGKEGNEGDEPDEMVDPADRDVLGRTLAAAARTGREIAAEARDQQGFLGELHRLLPEPPPPTVEVPLVPGLSGRLDDLVRLARSLG